MSKILDKTESLNQLNTLSLLAKAEKIAKDKFGGHLTIMRFTCHWKAMFGTPNLDWNGRKEVAQLEHAKTLQGALFLLISDFQTEN